LTGSYAGKPTTPALLAIVLLHLGDNKWIIYGFKEGFCGVCIKGTRLLEGNI